MRASERPALELASEAYSDVPNPIEYGNGLQISHRSPNSHYRLQFEDIEAPRLTHSLFRFPAKFHSPVAHALVREYTDAGETVLDPFCGSGTLLVVARAEKRNAIGTDIDPVATFVTKIKTHRYNPTAIANSWARLTPELADIARTREEYNRRRYTDIAKSAYIKVVEQEGLCIPDIPNIQHWFRNYVLIDLARILAKIEATEIPETHKNFFKLIFASIIRKTSNADPVPVSGLEVTSHMKRLDAKGRIIDPISQFIEAVEKAIPATTEFWDATSPQNKATVYQVDATQLTRSIKGQVDAIITSPPYHNAVDYYRRHKLEMFWLGMTMSQEERLLLLPRYIGRYNVSKRDPRLKREEELGKLALEWYKRIRKVSEKRSEAFLHYIISMIDAFEQLAKITSRGVPVVFVLGRSSWNRRSIPTDELFLEIGERHFELATKRWYPTKNRYMSYTRHNGADISEEYVLGFTRR